MGVSEGTKINERRARVLLTRLKKVDEKLDEIIKVIATTDEVSKKFWNSIEKEIRIQYEEARKITSDWTNRNVPATYKKQVQVQLAKLKRKKVTLPINIKYRQFINSDISKQSLASIVRETNFTFTTGYTSGEKTMVRLTRLTQQVNAQEKIIDRAIAKGFLEGGTVTKASKEVQTRLLKNALDGKYITVVDKNGKPTHWKINTYSDMVARTKLQETSTLGVTDTTIAVGADLIQVSSHNTLTPYDAQFEGKIFSLTGSDKQFPKAPDLPPFHPNCLHSITTVVKEALEVQDTLDDYVKFSKGETEIHPTRTSHIPVSQRVS